MNEYSKLAAMVSSEFSKYIIEHEDISKKIPQNALVIFLIEGENGFNKWSKELSKKNREENQPVIYIKVKRWRQKASLEELEVIMN